MVRKSYKPRASNPNLFEIYCYSCKKNTDNCEPCEIKKNPYYKPISNNYLIACKCNECHLLKHKKLNMNEISQLPIEIKDADANTIHSQIIREGKAFQLLSLLPHIISGIASLAPTVIDLIKGKTAGDIQKFDNKNIIKGRSIEEIINGGEISKDELKGILQILGGLGYECL